MQIKHSVRFDTSKEPGLLKYIESNDIKHRKVDLPGRNRAMLSLEIDESDSVWPELSVLLNAPSVLHGYDTYFSTAEILRSEWCRVISTFTQGYPQPEENWVTQPNNYVNVCRNCGTHEQAGSYRIKKEPNLGAHDFLTLNWAFFDFFCTTKVSESIMAYNLQGYQLIDAILHRTNHPSQTIHQIFPTGITQPGLLRTEELASITCKICGVTKYRHHLRGKMVYQRNAINPYVDLQRTAEWFGDGHSAYREVLASNKFVQLAMKERWKGIRFKPIETD